jgi:HK97 family phage portal protein
MNIVDKVRGWFVRNEYTNHQDPLAEIVVPGGKNASGITLRGDEALTLSAVWGCVQVIAESLAAIPVEIIERRGADRVPVESHPADWLLNTSPDDEMPAMTFRESKLAHALLWGNGYAEVRRSPNGLPSKLHLLRPERVKPVRRDSGELVYEHRDDDGYVAVLPSSSVLHLRGLGYDGTSGYSVVGLARQSLGLGAALESFGASYFGNGTHPAGILSTDAALKQEQVDQLRTEWERVHKGPRASNKAAILGGGMKWQSMTIPPEDAQFLESRRFQILEICRWFRVPPHMLGELERATYSNVEQMQIEFVAHCLLPWARRFEAEANLKLLGRNQRGRMSVRMNLEGLLRGDIKTRYEAYSIGRQNGWLSVNDVRRLEKMNPVPGGDDHHVQVNLVPLDLMREKAEKELDAMDRPPEPAPAVDPIDPADPSDPESDEGDDPSDPRVAQMSARLKLITGGQHG